jgi:phage gpG-like protein
VEPAFEKEGLVNFQDLEGLGVNIGRILKRFENSKPAFRAISDLMVASAQQNFETEGRPTKWAPLAPATQKFKDKHGWTRILLRSGALRRAITGAGGVTGKSATIGNNLVYAKIQNDGGTIEEPARTYTVRHRTDAKGNLLKQSQVGWGPHHRLSNRLLVFAKGKHKRFLERQFTGEAYKVTIPGRPFLVIQGEDVERYQGILYRFWFEGELSQ